MFQFVFCVCAGDLFKSVIPKINKYLAKLQQMYKAQITQSLQGPLRGPLLDLSGAPLAAQEEGKEEIKEIKEEVKEIKEEMKEEETKETMEEDEKQWEELWEEGFREIGENSSS